MSDQRPPKSPRKGKHVYIRIAFLNDTIHVFQVPVKGVGVLLWEAVVNHLQLLEADYFDLEYTNHQGDNCWLDREKNILKQIGSRDTLLRFGVKFYTPDPGLLEDELTRYLFALQVRKDLLHGELRCSENTAALLASYIVQGEIGDFDMDEFRDTSYLAVFSFVPDQMQTPEFMAKVMDYHKQHYGESPSEADLNLLDTARKVEMYGIKMHQAKDHEGVSLNLAVAHMGVLVFQQMTKINTFSWAKVRKISFKRKKFLIKLHADTYGFYKDTVEFFFESRDRCKLFWKRCIEHHAFFRCQVVAKVPRNKTRVVSRGSSFRYCGRTQKQLVEYVRENISKRPQFERSTSGRISSPSASTTPRFTSKIGMHSSSADLRNNSGSRSSGSHILDSNHTPNSGGGTTREPSTPHRLESADVHSDSSMSGSRSLNSPRLEHGLSLDQDVIEAVNARTGGAMTDDEEEEDISKSDSDQGQERMSHVASDTKVSALVPAALSQKDRKFSAPVFGSGNKAKGGMGEDDHRLSRTDEIENIPELVGAAMKSPRHSPPKRSSVKGTTRQFSNQFDNIDDLPPPPPSPPPLTPPSPPPPPPPFEDDDDSPSCLPQYLEDGTAGVHALGFCLDSQASSIHSSEELLNERFAEDADDSEHLKVDNKPLDISKSEVKSQRVVTSEERFSSGGHEQTCCDLNETNTSNLIEDSSKILEIDLSKDSRTPPGKADGGTTADSTGSILPEEERKTRMKLRPTDAAYYMAKELLMTERTYKKDLEVLCVWFRNVVSCDPATLNSVSQVLFHHFDPIYNFHFAFLKEVEHRLSAWEGKVQPQLNGEYQRIGDIMLRAINNFQKLYENYFLHLEETLTEINNKMRKQHHFEDICRGFESQKVCYLPLTTFLLRPGQRLLHIKLILERLVKHYSFTHHDVEDCKEALCRITEITNQFRDQFLRVENLEKLMELQRGLLGLENLVHTEREFIREGCLQKFSRKGYQQRMFFLFSDMLVYTSRTSSSILQFKVHGQLPLHGMTVEETDASKSVVQNCFAIYAGSKYILVAASTQEEKDKWIEDINDSVARVGAVKLQCPSLKSNASSSENVGSNEGIDGEEHPSPERGASQHRASTSMHVCWHRNTSVSMRDHQAALQNQLSGYLLRKFKTSSGWQKLWVVFTNFCLFFYKTYQDDYPLASLPLLGYAVSTPEEEDAISKEHVFKLQFKNHVYFFRAESGYTFSRWMEVINSATHSARRVRLFSRLDSRLDAS